MEPREKNLPEKSGNNIEYLYQAHSNPSWNGSDKLQKRRAQTNQKLVFFVGSDVTSHIILNHIIPELVKRGIQPVIYLAQENLSRQQIEDGAHNPIAESYRFYERKLNNNIIYPFLEAAGPFVTSNGKPIQHTTELGTRLQINLSPKQLGEAYNVTVASIKNVNDADFVKSLENDASIIGGISIRCYQIFKNDIINVFKDKVFQPQDSSSKIETSGFLWNMHPGKLPEYRGFLHPPYFSINGDTKYAWTLHDVVFDKQHTHKGIDTGPIIEIESMETNLSKSPIFLYFDFAPKAAHMVLSAIDKIESGLHGSFSFQDLKKGNYYNYRNLTELAAERLKINKADIDINLLKKLHPSDLSQIQRKALKSMMPNRLYVTADLASKFAPPSSANRCRLFNLLEQASLDFEYAGKDPKFTRDYRVFPEKSDEQDYIP